MKQRMWNIFALISIFTVVASSETVPVRLQRSTGNCGVPKIRTGLVILGQNITRGDFPWIVAMMYTLFKPPSYFCGGTLITSNFVVTAAHCILPKGAKNELQARYVRALFGAHELDEYLEPGRFALSPKKITIHNEWNPATESYDADISLLEFEQGSITLNSFVQPICLWHSENVPTETEGTIIGWGKSEDPTRNHENEPKKIKVRIQSNEECLPGEKELAGLASKKTFCAGHDNGSGVCHGDSGGGLSIQRNNIRYLVGIVSSSLLNDVHCDVSKNAIYTNVQKFQPWMENIIGAEIFAITSVLEKVFCTFMTVHSVSTCFVNQTLNSELYVLGSEFNTTVEKFHINDNRDVKFLPSSIGEKLPNLIQFRVAVCGLKIVRDHYFKNMKSLKNLYLDDNKIRRIEPGAFRDLVRVKELHLQYNIIETLDEKLFAKMFSLESLWLHHNKIQYLGLSTFKITGGALGWIDLTVNDCIHGKYGPTWGQLDSDITAKCREHTIFYNTPLQR